ncbi:hypothetical protein K1T71_011641 [Dendrolimus kikuchii]|uniref:Uncharacterized protein n=1 Tax=Dendrolimus kikuchii TaxID=765133 RepID=A0ACC1CLQ2_9NEOP|nr:hypothetical protein K1T71_011641 [Dendrolimus kikuchii]
MMEERHVEMPVKKIKNDKKEKKFLNRRRDIALGHNKTAQAREFARRMWEEIALSLNSQGDGAQKDWKGWCKYWNDYKCKLKKAAVANHRSMQQTGGGPPSGKPLTELEKKFIQILGHDFGLGLPGILESQADTQEIPEGGGGIAGGSESILTEVNLVPLSPPAPVDISQPSTSWQQPYVPQNPTSPIPIPSTSPPPLSPLTSTPLRSPPAVALPSTPRGSPRRRRRRREAPLTAEAARRALMRESQRRADLEEREAQRRAVVDERNSVMLRELVDEVKQIKDLLRRWTET